MSTADTTGLEVLEVTASKPSDLISSSPRQLPILLLIISLLISLLFSSLQLLAAAGLEGINDVIDEDWQLALTHASHVLVSVVAWWVVNRNSRLLIARGWLKYFVVVSVVGLMASIVDIYGLLNSVDSLLILAVNFASQGLVSLLSALMYFTFYSLIKNDHSNRYLGYRKPLVVGFAGAGVFSLLYIFEYPTFLLLVFTKLSLVLLLLACTRKAAVFDITSRRYIVNTFLVVALIIPLALFSKKPLLVGWVVAHTGVTILADAFFNEEGKSYSAETVAVDPDGLKQTLINTVPVFNDYWLLSGGVRLAVSTDKLMRSVDDGQSWEKVNDLAVYGES